MNRQVWIVGRVIHARDMTWDEPIAVVDSEEAAEAMVAHDSDLYYDGPVDFIENLP